MIPEKDLKKITFLNDCVIFSVKFHIHEYIYFMKIRKLMDELKL